MAGHLKIRQLTQPQDDPDFVLCMDYVRDMEYHRFTQKQFADKHKTTAVTVFRWRTAWEARGLLPAVRRFMAIDMNEDNKITERRAIRRWDEAMEELMSLATSAKREDVRLGAIQFLYRDFVKPFQEAQPDSGSDERDYLEFISKSEQALDPMSILRDDLDNYERKSLPGQSVEGDVPEQQNQSVDHQQGDEHRDEFNEPVVG